VRQPVVGQILIGNEDHGENNFLFIIGVNACNKKVGFGVFISELITPALHKVVFDVHCLFLPVLSYINLQFVVVWYTNLIFGCKIGTLVQIRLLAAALDMLDPFFLVKAALVLL
jgi:hypothetical protein